jgi:hypothetical protein
MYKMKHGILTVVVIEKAVQLKAVPSRSCNAVERWMTPPILLYQARVNLRPSRD